MKNIQKNTTTIPSRLDVNKRLFEMAKFEENKNNLSSGQNAKLQFDFLNKIKF